MYYSHLEIKNFGPIEEFNLMLSPEGVHVISGDNASGKTHVAAAILSALFGKETNFLRISNSPKKVFIKLSLTDKANVECLTFSVSPNGQFNHHVNFTSTSKLDTDVYPHNHLISITSNEFLPSLYLSEPNIGFELVEQAYYWYKEQYLVKEQLEGRWELVDNIFSKLDIGKEHCDRQMSRISSKEKLLISLILEYFKRNTYPIFVPLILDDPLALYPSSMIPIVKEIIEKIAEKHQVILLTSNERTQQYKFRSPVGIISLSEHVNESIKQAGINYTDFNKLITLKSAEVFQKNIISKLEQRQTALEGRVGKDLCDIKKMLGKIDHDISDVKDNIDIIISKTNLISEQIADELEQAILQNNEILISQICSDLSSKYSGILRKDFKPSSITKYFDELEIELGSTWSCLDGVIQKEIALSKHLYLERELDGIHLAILEMFRILEYVIMKHVFYRFKESIINSSLIINEQEIISSKYKQSYKSLYDFIMTDNKKLTLGEFAFIFSAAKHQKNVPLFSCLLVFMTQHYPLTGGEVMQKIKELQFDKSGQYLGIHETFNGVRNRCAHPPSISGDNSNIFNQNIYDAVWTHIMKKPIELLSLIITSEK